jgi:peroxiredoxin
MAKKASVVLGLVAIILLPAVLMLIAHRRLDPQLLKAGEPLPATHLKLDHGRDTVAQPTRRVLILYKATCSHCQRTIRDLTTLYRLHSDWFATNTGISVNLIATSNQPESLPGETGIPFSFYSDEHGQTSTAFKGSLVPYVLFVDERNTVQYSHVGELSLDQEQRLFQNFYQKGKAL